MFRKIFGEKRHEIVCISFPKAGRTWVRFALRLAGSNVKFSHGGYGTKDVEEIGREFEGLNKRFFGKRNIFLHRNPLDNAVSMFYQIHKRNFAPGSAQYDRINNRLVGLNRLPPADIDQFVLHPIWGCGNIAAFNAAHKAYFQDRRGSLIARYEDLRKDPHANFARILDFAGIVNYDIDRIVSESSFDRMRSLELSGEREDLKSNRLYGMQNNDTNTLKVRKGEVRGYSGVLKSETIEAAAGICARFGQEI